MLKQYIIYIAYNFLVFHFVPVSFSKRLNCIFIRDLYKLNFKAPNLFSITELIYRNISFDVRNQYYSIRYSVGTFFYYFVR